MLIFPYVIGIDQDLIPDFVQNITNQYNIIERKFYYTINFYQVIESSNPQKWIDAINEDIKSMKDNDVWDLFLFPEGVKPINCKWILKTKRDSKGNVERYKTHLIVKVYTERKHRL